MTLLNQLSRLSGVRSSCALIAALRLFFVMSCVVAGVSGCKDTDNDKDEAQSSTTSMSAAPTRIVAFAPSSVEIVTALGQSHRLIAIGDFCDEPLGAQSLPRVGGLFNPDLESILRLRPDLVILRGDNDDVVRLCSENGIRLYRDPVERLEDMFIAIDELGQLLDAHEAAYELSHSLRTRLDKILRATSNLPRPRVFFTISRRPDSLDGIITPGRGNFVTSMIELAGAENVFGGVDAPYPDVSPEAILAAQPDVIIEAMPEIDMTVELEHRIQQQWSALGPMPATRDGRIYILTDDHVLVPSPQIVNTVTRLVTLLHPEVHLD